MPKNQNSFAAEAESILSLKIAHRVHSTGGYGNKSEVIYEGHPTGCPSVLVDSKGSATATFMSNGSVGFIVKLADGMEVKVLDSHFDPVEKREFGTPSSNVWFVIGEGRNSRTVSLMNPSLNVNCPAEKIKIVKIGDPNRAMWYCAEFSPAAGIKFETAVKLSFKLTSKGPALVREVYVKNIGTKALTGNLWSYFNLHGTQKFVYNKEIWYDAGFPLSNTDSIMTARVPYSDIVQIKRQISIPTGFKPLDATCDYSTFVGDTSALVLLPKAIQKGTMLDGGAGKKINRFSTAAIAANQFSASIKPGTSASLKQILLFVNNDKICADFRKMAGYLDPTYKAMTQSFIKAANVLAKATNVIKEIETATASIKSEWPDFEVQLPYEKTVSEYANSVWIGVKELYENCRAHGAKLADGIELGTRDRGQDMWPKMKEDPARVRKDLIHAMSFMYVTVDGTIPKNRKLTLKEKLHGMFPRQYPSHWYNRKLEVRNDNRPYTDSPLWLLNSINMLIRETGDINLLKEVVPTIRLTTPDTPETSSIVGNDLKLPIVKVMEEVLNCFERHADDSPYGISQILYGDWCDPIDMFGTGKVGDAKTRGHGRGVQIRLSSHVFFTLVETIDILESKRVIELLSGSKLLPNVARLKSFAIRLRDNIIKWAWEDGKGDFPSAFLNCIHELNINGSVPNYKKGETGYTLGSMKGRDFDGIKRRELGGQAWALEMLHTERAWLKKHQETVKITSALLKTVDNLFYDKKLGLVMYTKPIANNQRAIELAGRMGVLPAGTAENGEYHHCQVMMHQFRLSVPGEHNKVWAQFKPMMSALRDESLCGPFETPSTSYVSDKDDPHFGKGMYFGLSGSVDWIVEVFHKLLGLRLNLHDSDKPALSISPILPDAMKGAMSFKRVIHVADGKGRYSKVPLSVTVKPANGSKPSCSINGKKADTASIKALSGLKKVEIEIIG
ncbi:MAG: hypothetical protein JNL74_19195 [Fibrobacteres bacterium]|nr:hypothetical protein [Fibrobacterota bacterium]